jgi:mono/diheme cytochrome c family protein
MRQRMKKILKLAGWLIGGVLVAVGITVALNHSRSNEILQKPHSVKVRPVAMANDAATITRGKHLAESRGCMDCHGKDLGGARVEESFPMGKWYGPNLTGGAGSRAGKFTDEDWVRAIRHGVGPDQRPLYLMPSEEYQHLSDADLAAVIAYARSVPKVERPTVPLEFGPIARMLIATGKIKLPADVIDHAASNLRRWFRRRRRSTAAISLLAAPAATARTFPAARLKSDRPTGRRPRISRPTRTAG